MNNTEAATGKAYGGRSSLSGFQPLMRGSNSNATPSIQPDDDNEDDPLLLMSKTIYVDDKVACNCSFCLAYKIVSGEASSEEHKIVSSVQSKEFNNTNNGSGNTTDNLPGGFHE